jgi:hypothetical protein
MTLSDKNQILYRFPTYKTFRLFKQHIVFQSWLLLPTELWIKEWTRYYIFKIKLFPYSSKTSFSLSAIIQHQERLNQTKSEKG